MYICIWKSFSLKKWECTGSFLIIPLGHALSLNSFIHPAGNPSAEMSCAATYIRSEIGNSYHVNACTHGHIYIYLLIFRGILHILQGKLS